MENVKLKLLHIIFMRGEKAAKKWGKGRNGIRTWRRKCWDKQVMKFHSTELLRQSFFLKKNGKKEKKISRRKKKKMRVKEMCHLAYLNCFFFLQRFVKRVRQHYRQYHHSHHYHYHYHHHHSRYHYHHINQHNDETN